jgi:hypothetical protein
MLVSTFGSSDALLHIAIAATIIVEDAPGAVVAEAGVAAGVTTTITSWCWWWRWWANSAAVFHQTARQRGLSAIKRIVGEAARILRLIWPGGIAAASVCERWHWRIADITTHRAELIVVSVEHCQLLWKYARKGTSE